MWVHWSTALSLRVTFLLIRSLPRPKALLRAWNIVSWTKAKQVIRVTWNSSGYSYADIPWLQHYHTFWNVWQHSTNFDINIETKDNCTLCPSVTISKLLWYYPCLYNITCVYCHRDEQLGPTVTRLHAAQQRPQTNENAALWAWLKVQRFHWLRNILDWSEVLWRWIQNK